jgi:enoyl-CoA hydratase/carnithine racemase
MSAQHSRFSVASAVEGHVGIVTFACPPYNHVSVALLEALADALHALDDDDACRVVLLQSDGRIFCAGADFTAGGDFAQDDENAQTLALYAQAVRLYSTRKPLIVAVQGAAIGAGLGLALVGDFRISTDDARFSANFVKLGFHAGFGISVRLPEIVGGQMAARMLLTAERISGLTAFDRGLVDELAAPGDLTRAAMAFAVQIAENAPLAVEATRHTLRAGLAERIAAATAREAELQARLKKTADFAEGIRAVAERRPGAFVRG